jgi:hypothetical protein
VRLKITLYVGFFCSDELLRYMAVGQLFRLAPRTYGVGLENSRHGLARIVAVAHSGVMQCQQSDAIRLKYKGFQLISYPNARTTSG